MKKFLSIMLCVVMVLSLTACGQKPYESMFELFDEAMTFSNGEYSYQATVSVKLDDDQKQSLEEYGYSVDGDYLDVGIGIKGVVDNKENAFTADLTVSMLGKTVNLTDIAIIDNALYLNMEKTIDAIASQKDTILSLAGEYVDGDAFDAIIQSAKDMLGGKTYLKVDVSDTDEIAPDEVSSIEELDYSDYIEAIKNSEFWKAGYERIKNVVGSIKPELVVKNKDGSYTMTLTQDSVKTIYNEVKNHTKESAESAYTLIKTLAELKDGQLAMSIYESLSSNGSLGNEYAETNEEAIGLINSKKENIITNIKTLFPDEELEIEDMTFTYTVGKVDGTIVQNIAYQNADGAFKLAINTTQKDVGLKAPGNVMTVDELSDAISNSDIVGSLMGFGADSYGDYEDYDDYDFTMEDTTVELSDIEDENVRKDIEYFLNLYKIDKYAIENSFDAYDIQYENSANDSEQWTATINVDDVFGIEKNHHLYSISYTTTKTEASEDAPDLKTILDRAVNFINLGSGGTDTVDDILSVYEAEGGSIAFVDTESGSYSLYTSIEDDNSYYISLDFTVANY